MKFITAVALSLIVLISNETTAQTSDITTQWTLDSANSTVNFVTIKNGNIAETHVFNDVSGSVDNGLASVTIRPDSVDSRVPIRNDRMREFLFETGLYPTIEVKADVNKAIKELSSEKSSLLATPVMLSMHGVDKEHTLELRVSQINENTIIVASTQAVLVRAADYNMVEGITKLSSLVNDLPIVETVPVIFSLQFSRN